MDGDAASRLLDPGTDMPLFDDDEAGRSRDPAAGRELDVQLVLEPDQCERIVVAPALEHLCQIALCPSRFAGRR